MRSGRRLVVDDLIDRTLAGSRRALARLITLVERGDKSAEIIPHIYPHTGQAHIVGITGPPGSGKSTLVNALAKTIRQHEPKVAIVAVDPTSPFTGGALLGDRIRMNDLYGDPNVFIRSMASRGKLGGLAQATADVVKVLDAAGYGVILVETVGAGQAEVDIARTAHTTVVVETPGMGDEVQSIKAGVLESADILVVNKADRIGKEATVRALRTMLQLGHSTREHNTWQPPILETIATNAHGIPSLYEKIKAHKQHLKTTSLWQQRERTRCQHEIEQLLTINYLAQIKQAISDTTRDDLITAVANRHLDPYTAATQLQSTGEKRA